jgi:hypothetical protein
MGMTDTKPKVFYGWWIALTGSLALFLSTVTLVVYPFGVFARAIAHELHVGRATISLAFAIRMTVVSVFARRYPGSRSWELMPKCIEARLVS